jgi:hypothetical protein
MLIDIDADNLATLRRPFGLHKTRIIFKGSREMEVKADQEGRAVTAT